MSTGIMRPINRVISINTLRRRNTGNTVRPAQPPVALPYLTFAPTIGRNSVPHLVHVFLLSVGIRRIDGRTKGRAWRSGVSRSQRFTLDLIRYLLHSFSGGLILAYFFGFLFFSWLCYGPWIARDSYYGGIVNADGIGRGWWAIFTTVSMFSNTGSHTP